MKQQGNQDIQMKAFASASDVIKLTEGWRAKLKQFEGQEERNQYLSTERDSYREMVGRLNRTIKQMNTDIWDLQQKENALDGENSLLKAVLERKGIDITEPENAEGPKRFSIKRILGITAVVAPYALIGSYVVSLFV